MVGALRPNRCDLRSISSSGLVPGPTVPQIMVVKRERTPCVYILANRYNGALYVGATSNLVGRMLQHREGMFDGHTKTYRIHRLVYYEVAETMEAAIRREKQLKRWRREWKRNLIERQNPEWNDLAVGLGLEPLEAVAGGAVDPGTRPG